MPRSNVLSWMKEEQHRSHCALFANLYTVQKKVEFKKINSKYKFNKGSTFKMYNLIKIINSKCKFNKDNEFKM